MGKEIQTSLSLKLHVTEKKLQLFKETFEDIQKKLTYWNIMDAFE